MDNKNTKAIISTLFFSVFCYLPGILHAELLNKGFEYVYVLSKNDFTVAHVNRKLDVTSNRLIFTSTAYPVGFASLFISDTITEQSIISHANNALYPQSYSYVKKADEIKEQFHIQFNLGNNTVTDSRVSKPFKLTGNTFDSLSFQLALAKTLNTSKPDLTFTLIDNKHLKTYTLEVNGEEQLETEAGTFNTLKFFYYDEIKKRKIFIWCAKQLGYLPIQITRIDNDGDYGTLKLISLSPEPTTEAEDDTDENSNDF